MAFCEKRKPKKKKLKKKSHCPAWFESILCERSGVSEIAGEAALSLPALKQKEYFGSS
jgi:hypothetical protein